MEGTSRSLARALDGAPLCDIPSGCCFFTGPWTVTRSSLRMWRRVAAFCRPLRPELLLVSRDVLEDRKGAGGSGTPKVCVPKMAQQVFPVSPDAPFGLGGGGPGGGITSLLLRCTAILIPPDLAFHMDRSRRGQCSSICCFHGIEILIFLPASSGSLSRTANAETGSGVRYPFHVLPVLQHSCPTAPFLPRGTITCATLRRRPCVEGWLGRCDDLQRYGLSEVPRAVHVAKIPGADWGTEGHGRVSGKGRGWAWGGQRGQGPGRGRLCRRQGAGGLGKTGWAGAGVGCVADV